MADMSNEQAARVLTKEADGWGDERVLFGTYLAALRMGAAALREKAERERGWGCAYCVIGRRSPDARYCSNCGRKLTPALPELANESEEVNPDSHQYVDNDSTNRRKSVKQKCRNLHSETADPDTGLMPCGCGGKAKLGRLEYTIADPDLMPEFYAYCQDCGLTTENSADRELVENAWNRAMGRKGGAE